MAPGGKTGTCSRPDKTKRKRKLRKRVISQKGKKKTKAPASEGGGVVTGSNGALVKQRLDNKDRSRVCQRGGVEYTAAT